MKIRKAKIKDIPNIVKLNYTVMSHHLNFDKKHYKSEKSIKTFQANCFKKSIYSKDKIIYVAEDKNKIVGCISGFNEQNPSIFITEKFGWVEMLIAAQKYRNKGVGRDLVNELMRWFTDKNIKYIKLSVNIKNISGISFWEKFGFKGHILRMKKSL